MEIEARRAGIVNFGGDGARKPRFGKPSNLGRPGGVVETMGKIHRFGKPPNLGHPKITTLGT
jgi:hypothetical protein